jgi:hypothetical protein
MNSSKNREWPAYGCWWEAEWSRTGTRCCSRSSFESCTPLQTKGSCERQPTSSDESGARLLPCTVTVPVTAPNSWPAARENQDRNMSHARTATAARNGEKDSLMDRTAPPDGALPGETASRTGSAKRHTGAYAQSETGGQRSERSQEYGGRARTDALGRQRNETLPSQAVPRKGE